MSLENHLTNKTTNDKNVSKLLGIDSKENDPRIISLRHRPNKILATCINVKGLSWEVSLTTRNKLLIFYMDLSLGFANTFT